MAYFPFMIEVKGHKALVVGAGRSAAGKIRDLADFGADVTVVAPVISADVVKQGKSVHIERRVYRPGETKGYEIIVAATDNPAVNKQVAHDAARFGAICTVADDPHRGGFIFPAIIKGDKFSIAISTDGKDDDLESSIKNTLKAKLPEKEEELAALLTRNGRDGAAGTDGETIGGQERNDAPRERLADIPGMSTVFENTEEAADEAEHAQEEPENESRVIRLGARDNRLDQILTDNVITMLSGRGYECEKVKLRYGEAEAALTSGEVDLVVRRAVDIPPVLPEGITVAACLPREDARDILVTRMGTDKNDINVIGTSEEVRKAQIERFLSLGEVTGIEGTVQERIKKLKDRKYDALIFDSCEVKKLMLIMDGELSFEFIQTDKSLPMAGQGITAVECRTDGKAHDAALDISDDTSMKSLEAEREFLRASGAVRNDEASAYSVINDGKILMKVMKPIAGKCVCFAGYEDEGRGLELARSLAERIKNAEE
ncbi:MAG: hypothetical protein IKF54_00400 [Eubacterium sp.]|nr:hypothetical protein [Eubacterium sp.]